MPYYNVTPHGIYDSSIGTYGSDWGPAGEPMTKACMWVACVNTYDTYKLVIQWFWRMEEGGLDTIEPDPDWRTGDYPEKAKLTQDLADAWVEGIDEDFNIEKGRFRGRNPPEFLRLPGPARIALMQEVYRVQMSTAQIRQEAERRLEEGEELPPPKGVETDETRTRLGIDKATHDALHSTEQ